MEPLRIGILGAACIAELAIVKPAHATGTRLPNLARSFSRLSGVSNLNGAGLTPGQKHAAPGQLY
jgi:hypothetical protein